MFNYKELLPETVAALVFGLPRESRIKRKISKEKYSMEEMLLMRIVDKLSILIWQNTKNGQNGTNFPESIFNKLCGEVIDSNNPKKINEYENSDDFDSMWNKLKGRKNG